jgi:hypothetical protein
MSIAGLPILFRAPASAVRAERKSGDGDCVIAAFASSGSGSDP